MPRSTEASQIKILNKTRDVLIARQTNFKKYLDEIEQNNIDKSIKDYDILIIVEIESRVERHQLVLQEFDKIQNEIEMLSENLDEEINIRGEFESIYHKLLAVAKNILNKYYETSKANSDEDRISVASGSVESRFQSNISKREIKLPDIKLPSFSGDYCNFLEFRDLFDSLINSDDSLAPIQKFHYLRASLAGGAAQVIRSIEFQGENYDLAWSTLCNRYYNRAILVDTHVRALFELPIITHESSEELRKMLDTICKHLRSLEALSQPIAYWDTLLLHIFNSKLDRKTAREWEEKRVKKQVMMIVETEGAENNSEANRTLEITGDQGLVTLESFKTFIRRKADLLETLELSRSMKDKGGITDRKSKGKSFPSMSQSLVSTESVCVVCKKEHTINNCPEFNKLSMSERVDKVKGLRLCFNCLRGGHSVKACNSSACRKCRGKHHTLIHFEKPEKSNSSTRQQNPQLQVSNTAGVSENVVLSSGVGFGNNSVVLQTALVQILDGSGIPRVCRAMLDGGSQSNLISSKCVERLGIQRYELPLTILGVGGTKSELKYRCQVKVQSCLNTFELDLSCVVIPSICANYPSVNIDISTWNIPHHLILADPKFHEEGEIDLLIGAGVYLSLLCIGQVKLGSNLPTLQKTRFGWVLSGSYDSTHISSIGRCNLSVDCDVRDQLAKFWEVEESYSSKPSWSSEEKECEECFVKTTTRDKAGRFMVKIPFKQSSALLGESKSQALSRFRSLEQKLVKNSKLKELYCKFMEEYIQLGHMSRVDNPEEAEAAYYFPHHGVLNEKNQTTKLRVVFDGSAQTDTGISLNDIQHVGPTIQEDVLSILLRFREHSVVICADVVKMYRQIWVHPDQRCFQRIFWRNNPSEEIQIYELNTVTYGNASSPFLAVRCLMQVAKDNSLSYPMASRVIERDCYMDDIITSMDSLEDAILLCDELREMLRSGGFELQKWASNRREILQHVRENNASAIIKIGDENKTKTLGLDWISSTDVLAYHIAGQSLQRVTKRVILSEISLIFDPLGLLAPVVIVAKIMLQKLWMYKLSWDESIPLEIDTRWKTVREQMSSLNSLRIPRQVSCECPVQVEIHGFSDASLEAYGACVYVHTISAQGDVQVRLLVAKSRVAPLKTITIPKLELCGALILAQLIHKVKSSMTMNVNNYFLWCDSTVCLGWIKTQPNLLQTFVSNRVSQIQGMTNPSDWNYVRTKENPADLLSRGVMPKSLEMSSLWWNGPSWLSLSRDSWPLSVPETVKNLPELKKAAVVLATVELELFPFKRFSKLYKLKRVMAYILRFIDRCRKRGSMSGPLTTKELENASCLLVKVSQAEHFSNEIKSFRNEKPLSKNNNLLKLSPFLDSNGVLRVGGRLELSSYSYDKKHPALLSAEHHLTKLIFESEHLRLLHAGPQLLLSRIRDRYWPTKGRILARRTAFKCIRCFRSNPSQRMPFMGMLPSARITCAAPFQATGVDYAGPCLIKEKKGRGSKTSKCYIAVFVCFSTKCIHLELVSDLTTEAFLAAFRRFTSRRSVPAHVYSDNGKTFQGARNELAALGKFLNTNRYTLSELCANEGVQWHFIPAYSPHMGGLWEAGVKSCKSHLKKVLANAALTFEEMYTVLVQIEAILNSRPLCPLSSDPNDLTALTPSHFLIGKPLTSIPCADYQEIPENRLSKFQRLQQLQQHFWTRWTREYLSQLQFRVKWKSQETQVKVNDLVILREDNSPPPRWELGRIIDLHPGKDKVVRVVSIKTQRGIVRRALAKVCILPLEKDFPSSEVQSVTKH